MVSPENVSRARELLDKAASPALSGSSNRLERHLLVAAALGEVLTDEPIVVGGTAEDFYTADEYHETDLDVVTWPLTKEERDLLVDLGFEEPVGRHWYHATSGVAVEIPESTLEGDPSRVHEEAMPPGRARIIGVEDLYLDRIRQATSDPANETFERSALAIATTRYESLDWEYVDEVVHRPHEQGDMKRIDSLIRRRARKTLSSPANRRRSRSARTRRRD